jgi:membrane protease YdiL (CAAX protease family)
MSKDSSKPVRKDLGGPLRLILNALLIFLISQFIAAFIAEFGLGLVRHGQSLDQSIGAQFVYVLIAEGLAAWLVFKLVRRRGLSLSFIGLGRRPTLNDLWKAAIGFIVFYAALIIVSLVLASIIPSLNFNQTQDVGFSNINTGLDSILAFFALVISPPLGEEPLLRGYLFSGLRSRWKFWPAALLTSFLFGLAHLNGGVNASVIWAAAVDTFILSLVLVYLRENTNALYAGILVHMLNNLVAFSVHIK